jgi:CyaY protein
LQEIQYEKLVEDVFNDIEDAVDELDHDIDVDASGGILNIAFPNQTSVVVSRQISNQEIWVAARSGGFHLGYVDGFWTCGTTGERLSELLDRVFSEQLAEPVTLFGS